MVNDIFNTGNSIEDVMFIRSTVARSTIIDIVIQRDAIGNINFNIIKYITVIKRKSVIFKNIFVMCSYTLHEIVGVVEAIFGTVGLNNK